MPLVIGQEIPEWNPEMVLQELTEEGTYESELIMVFSIYRKKGHDLTKDTAEGILHSFRSGFIDVMLLAAAGLLRVPDLHSAHFKHTRQ